MKKLLLILPALLFLASCASVNLNSHQLTQAPKKYDKLLVMMSHSEEMFYEWNEENYNYVLFTKFNDLDHDQDRKRILNSLRPVFNPNKLLFVNDFFPIHKPIDFESFSETLSILDFDAVLLIQIRGKWMQEDVIDGDLVSRPNTDKHVFLLDRDSLETVWMAKARAFGTGLNDFQDLYYRFSKDLAKDLHMKGFIEQPKPTY